MEPIEQLRTKIEDFPGYGGDIERRRSDEYVRSYLGEALASLAARHLLSAPLQQRIDDLVLRVGFADPRNFAIRHVLASGEKPDDDGGAVAVADAAMLELADRAESIELASAGTYLDEVTATLDAREAAIRAAAKPLP